MLARFSSHIDKKLMDYQLTHGNLTLVTSWVTSWQTQAPGPIVACQASKICSPALTDEWKAQEMGYAWNIGPA